MTRVLQLVVVVVMLIMGASQALAQVGKPVTIADANLVPESDLAMLPGLTPVIVFDMREKPDADGCRSSSNSSLP